MNDKKEIDAVVALLAKGQRARIASPYRYDPLMPGEDGFSEQRAVFKAGKLLADCLLAYGRPASVRMERTHASSPMGPTDPFTYRLICVHLAPKMAKFAGNVTTQPETL